MVWKQLSLRLLDAVIVRTTVWLTYIIVIIRLAVQVRDLVMWADFDRDGRLSLQEFTAATLPRSVYLNASQLDAVFTLLDVTNDGVLTTTDLANASATPEDIALVFEESGCDGNGAHVCEVVFE